MDLFRPRPTLTRPSLIAGALRAIEQETPSRTDVWRKLTDSYAVDLDAVARMLPRSEPEPIWLPIHDNALSPTRRSSHADRISMR